MSKWWNQLIQEMTEEETLIFKDDLTNLYNRRFYKMRLKQAIQKNVSSETPISFLMLDLDHFKSINDTYGHQSGDQALIHVSGIMRQVVQDRGIVIRYAGDEFLIILPEQDRVATRAIAEEIGYSVASTQLEIRPQKKIVLTLSIGCAASPEDSQAAENLFEMADIALYVSKENGRNQVSLVGDKVRSKEAVVGNFPCPEFIGREPILDSFQKQIHPFSKNYAFFFGGSSGIGKTRFLQECFSRLKKEPSFRCLETKCESQEQTAYVSLMNIFEQILWMEMEERDTLLQGLTEDEKWVVGHYFPPLKSPNLAPPKNLKNLLQTKDSFFLSGTEKVLQNIAQKKILVFLFDDIHWMDEYSLGLFFKLLYQEKLPFLLLGAYQTPLAPAALLTSIFSDPRISLLPISVQELPALTPAEIKRMIQSIRPKFEPDSEFLELCQQYTQGVPRKIEIVLQKLIETQKLFWVEGECRTQLITPLDFTAPFDPKESSEKGGFQPLPPPMGVESAPTTLDFNFSAEAIADSPQISPPPPVIPTVTNSTLLPDTEIFEDPQALLLEASLPAEQLRAQIQEIEQSSQPLEDLVKDKIRPLLETLLLFPENNYAPQLSQILTKQLDHPEAEKRKKALLFLKMLSESQSNSCRRRFWFLVQKDFNQLLQKETQQDVFMLALMLIPNLIFDFLFQGEYERALYTLERLQSRKKEAGLEAKIQTTLDKLASSHVLELLLIDLQNGPLSQKTVTLQILGILGEAVLGNLTNILLHSDNFRVRLSSIEALKEIGPQAIHLVLQLLNEKTSPQVYCRILSLDTALPEDPELNRLKKALLHPSSEVRQEALVLLLRKEAPQIESILKEVFQQGSSESLLLLLDELKIHSSAPWASFLSQMISQNFSPEVTRKCIRLLGDQPGSSSLL